MRKVFSSTLTALRIAPSSWHKAAQRRSCSPIPFPQLELLEPRAMLAANLQAGSLTVSSGAIVGEQVTLAAAFKSTDLVAGSQFTIQILIDGHNLLTKTFPAREGVDQLYRASIDWFARPGKLELRVDLDNTIKEADESDNVSTLAYTSASPGLTSKFVSPVGAMVGRDAFIFSYLDVDTDLSRVADYMDGRFAYEGHSGNDFFLGELFPGMDQGVPVYAAAEGTVTDLQAGFFDRESARILEGVANYVTIGHGLGILTKYWHLAANSVTVKIGDRVRAGQLIGLVGSSGWSSGPHLHFEVQHNDRLVETNFAPELYWHNPFPYTESYPVSVWTSGITNYTFPAEWRFTPQTYDLQEGPSTVDQFPVSSNWNVTYWAMSLPTLPTDNVQVRWYRPDDTLEVAEVRSLAADTRYSVGVWTLHHDRWSQHVGTWHVALVINGREVDRQAFEVTTGPGVPEMRVTQGSTYIIDGRTTPIEFGTASAAGTGAKKTFTIQNHGSVDLTTSDLELPPGFSLVGNFPAKVAPGSTADFVLQLNNAPAGAQFGEIRFRTNDADESEFEFNVQGVINGARLAGAPVLGINQPAQAYINSGAPIAMAPAATLVDTDSTTFNGGSLTVELASGAQSDDRLAIRHQGNGTGQIGVQANTVTYEGTSIGTWSGGTGRTPLTVSLNAAATTVAVRALVRNVTFFNVSLEPATRHRYVRFTLVDDTGKTSNLPIANIVIDPRLGGPNPTGDVNGDHVVNAADLDLIAAQIASGKFDAKFNFVADDVIDDQDLDFIVKNVLHTTRGDLDLDGDVDSADLAALLAGWTGVQQPQTGRASWSTGDMDGDGDTDSADLLELLGQWTGAAATSRRLVQEVVD